MSLDRLLSRAGHVRDAYLAALSTLIICIYGRGKHAS